jgi:hypothetical protein|tara:strand:+ start:426 stop:584 length:159 start_codon:yes stop_codon:yes gene_type:complete
MTFSDIKIYTLNSFAFAMSLSGIETTLKIVLLLASIGYTLHKWYMNFIKNKN